MRLSYLDTDIFLQARDAEAQDQKDNSKVRAIEIL